MPGIQPTSGVVNAQWSQAAQQIGKTEMTPKANFSDLIKDAIQTVDGEQQQSSSMLQDLLAGRRQDTMAVASQVAKADMSFKLLMGVRNKMISAYKQTMNMQV
ncbi:MAG: flagellar hook-basal body complex protein FliE [Planctomycetota bacterium]